MAKSHRTVKFSSLEKVLGNGYLQSFSSDSDTLIGYKVSTFHSLRTQNTTQTSKSSDTTLVKN